MELYKKGHIIIQDRASCFPATILAECFEDDFHKTIPDSGEDGERVVKLIDACSAPGNKTTHLAALAGCTSSLPASEHHRVAAFERDPRRSQILQKMVKTAGADACVDVTTLDFTQSNPADYDNVVGLVVDPSCSGSGIFGRGFVEAENDDDDDDGNENANDETTGDAEAENAKRNENDRLLKLAGFQFKIVKHALSFPAARFVVYSTCSIHAIENEHVVERLLLDPAVRHRGWRVRSRAAVLPGWPRRGFETEFSSAVGKTVDERKKLAEGCVRAVAKEDGGIGFFAVCFERKDGDDDDDQIEQDQEILESGTQQTQTQTLTKAQKKREKKKKQKQLEKLKQEQQKQQDQNPKEEDVEMDSENDEDEEEWTGFE